MNRYPGDEFLGMSNEDPMTIEHRREIQRERYREHLRRLQRLGEEIFDPFNDGPLPLRPDEQPREQQGDVPAIDEGGETEYDEVDDFDEGDEPLPPLPVREEQPAREEQPEMVEQPAREDRREAAARAASQRQQVARARNLAGFLVAVDQAQRQNDPLRPPQATRRRMPPSELDRYRRN
jgi:hypothetical protein